MILRRVRTRTAIMTTTNPAVNPPRRGSFRRQMAYNTSANRPSIPRTGDNKYHSQSLRTAAAEEKEAAANGLVEGVGAGAGVDDSSLDVVVEVGGARIRIPGRSMGAGNSRSAESTMTEIS